MALGATDHQALQARIGRQPFVHQIVEGRGQLADLVARMHRQRVKRPDGAQRDNGVAQLDERRHQAQVSTLISSAVSNAATPLQISTRRSTPSNAQRTLLAGSEVASSQSTDFSCL
jgi:hypothetical protein